jgi:hypothetical protein
MSRISLASAPRCAKKRRDLAALGRGAGAGARLASRTFWNAVLTALFAVTYSGCVVTDPVKFQNEVDVPPVILDDPSLPNGSIIKFQKELDPNAPGAKEININLTVRDDNVNQPILVRTRITKADNTVILSQCPDAQLARQGVPLSYYTLTIPQGSLKTGECHKVEVVVSSKFEGCYKNDDTQNSHFDVVANPDDIARATYWIWEVGNNVLDSAAASKILVNSCNKTIEYKP